MIRLLIFQYFPKLQQKKLLIWMENGIGAGERMIEDIILEDT